MRTLSHTVVNGLLLAVAVVVLVPMVVQAFEQLLVPALVVLAVFVVARLIWRATML